MNNFLFGLYRLIIGFITFVFLWWAFGPKLAIAFFLVLWTVHLEFTE